MKKIQILVGIHLVFIPLMLVSFASLAADRLELENTSIVGSRELPKVLYVVPWKKAQIETSLAGASDKGIFDEGMKVLDRDVLLREIKYFSALSASESTPNK
jgi:hypothetical protein